MIFRLKIPPGLGKSFWFAALILLCAELALHSESIMQRYRSVFAVGRAMDKLHHVEKQPPRVLFMGNSRTDNGIDPRAVSHALGRPAAYSFNLGLPGANVLIYHGIVERLDARGLLGAQGIHTVVLGLDESALQEDNLLGYVGFLADRAVLWESGRYQDWLGSYLRLWSYSANLRQLREPDKVLRFIEASSRQVDPIGGGRGGPSWLSCRIRCGAEPGPDRASGKCGTAPPRAWGRVFLVACGRCPANPRRSRICNRPPATRPSIGLF